MDEQFKMAAVGLMRLVLDLNEPDFPLTYQFWSDGTLTLYIPFGCDKDNHEYIPEGKSFFRSLSDIKAAKEELLRLHKEFLDRKPVSTFYVPDQRKINGERHNYLEEIGSTWREAYESCIKNDYNDVIVEVNSVGSVITHKVDDHRGNDLWIAVKGGEK